MEQNKQYRRRIMLFELSKGILESISVDVEIGPWCGSVPAGSVRCHNDISSNLLCLQDTFVITSS
jgi:hypothetical protein